MAPPRQMAVVMAVATSNDGKTGGCQAAATTSSQRDDLFIPHPMYKKDYS